MSQSLIRKIYIALSSTSIRLAFGAAILMVYVSGLLLPATVGAESIEATDPVRTGNAALEQLAKPESLTALGTWNQGTWSNVLCVVLILAMTLQSVAHSRASVLQLKASQQPTMEISGRLDKLIETLEGRACPYVRFASDEERQHPHGGSRR
jgi:hypothetical protein